MTDYETSFKQSLRPHILMISNHGIHQWEIIPGLPDTGGQNVFVNQFTAALAKKGFKITIVNRGGYSHPTTGKPRIGTHYKDDHQRILYLQDGYPHFVRKEDMEAQIPELNQALRAYLDAEGLGVDLIISHYWDGAKLGAHYNRSLVNPVKHIWAPHSLGAIKKRNVQVERWPGLRIDERIAIERELVDEVDGIAATSATIHQSLKSDYDYRPESLFLPPCVDPERYYPREIAADHPIWGFLSRHCGLSNKEIRAASIITEISRTDTTKRKNILIKAFARVCQRYPNALLLVTIDATNASLAAELQELISSLQIKRKVAVLGSVWDELPDIYAVTDIYCIPSVMEGFGMTPQEAAATGVPVVSSHLVPFVIEYLLGPKVENVQYGSGAATPSTCPKTSSCFCDRSAPELRPKAQVINGQVLKVGAGAIVVPADDVAGFAKALQILLRDDALRKKMGDWAYHKTIPYFTWDSMVGEFLENIR